MALALSSCALLTDGEPLDDPAVSGPVSADAQRARVIVSAGSPVPALVAAPVADAVSRGDAASCAAIDAEASAGLQGSAFTTGLEEFQRAYPSAGAELVGQLAFVAELLGACASGRAAGTGELEELERITVAWAAEL